MASIWLLAGALALSFGATTVHAESQYTSSPLSGKKLRYMIGAENPGKGRSGEILEVSYDWSKPLPADITIAYCNLFNEKYSEQNENQRVAYGPYLKTSDTAQEYGEGQIDPRGPGWRRNLTEQFERRKRQGFESPLRSNTRACRSRTRQPASTCKPSIRPPNRSARRSRKPASPAARLRASWRSCA